MKFTIASISALSLAFATTAFAEGVVEPNSVVDPSGYGDYEYYEKGYGYEPYEKDYGYEPYEKDYGYEPYPKKNKRKGGYRKGAKAPNKYTSKSDGGDGASDCAPKYCDILFKKANKYYYDRNLAGYSDYDDYYAKDAFTREDCKWDPAAYYGPQCKYLDDYQEDACECFWNYEVQCKTNLVTKPYKDGVKPDESELELAKEVKYAIENDKIYGKLFTDCFDDDIYNCLCSFHDGGGGK